MLIPPFGPYEGDRPALGVYRIRVIPHLRVGFLDGLLTIPESTGYGRYFISGSTRSPDLGDNPDSGLNVRHETQVFRQTGARAVCCGYAAFMRLRRGRDK